MPTDSPETRERFPESESPETMDPVVTDHVRSGSVSPYCLLKVLAVTVIGRCVIDNCAPT